MRQCGDGLVIRSRGAGEEVQRGVRAEDRRNRRERPDRTMRSQVVAVQQAEVLGHFRVATHRVRHARTGVDAYSVVPISARKTVRASNNMKASPWPPSSALPRITSMSPIGAAEPFASARL